MMHKNLAGSTRRSSLRSRSYAIELPALFAGLSVIVQNCRRRASEFLAAKKRQHAVARTRIFVQYEKNVNASMD